MAKLPLVPTVVTPDGDPLQDSTPIMEILEKKIPEPSIIPSPCAVQFVSLLIEEFADEWANKWMMHFRWYRIGSEHDSEAYSRKIAVEMKSGAAVGSEELEDDLSSMAEFFKQRMLGRGFTVGSNEVIDAAQHKMVTVY